MQNVPEFMQIQELVCNYIILHSDTQACTQLHKLACCYISLHAVAYACMQLHKLACSFFLRLSSSQEFCSACLPEQSFMLKSYGLSGGVGVGV